MLSAATIVFRVPQTPEYEAQGSLSVVGISEVLAQDRSPAPRVGMPKSVATIRPTVAHAASSPVTSSPPETAPQSAHEPGSQPKPETQPTDNKDVRGPEAPGTASPVDTSPAQGATEPVGTGAAIGTAPGSGPAARQTASPGGQEEFLSQDKVTDVPIIPAGEVLARIEYPPLAARQGIEAVVYLELYIDEQGRVRRVNVLKDPGYGFAEAAVRAVTGVTCTPAKAGGHSVAVRFRFPVRFSLN